MMQLILIYSGFAGLMAAFLSILVIRQRWRVKSSLGDHGDIYLQRAIRAHGNFLEFTPLFLLLLLLLVLIEMNTALLHGLALLFFAGRIIHAFGISREPETIKFRMIGMVMTLMALISVTLLCLFVALTI
jgi:uncharacterized membrane protein YecN with MAPEG domain